MIFLFYLAILTSIVFCWEQEFGGNLTCTEFIEVYNAYKCNSPLNITLPDVEVPIMVYIRGKFNFWDPGNMSFGVFYRDNINYGIIFENFETFGCNLNLTGYEPIDVMYEISFYTTSPTIDQMYVYGTIQSPYVINVQAETTDMTISSSSSESKIFTKSTYIVLAISCSGFVLTLFVGIGVCILIQQKAIKRHQNSDDEYLPIIPSGLAYSPALGKK